MLLSWYLYVWFNICLWFSHKQDWLYIINWINSIANFDIHLGNNKHCHNLIIISITKVFTWLEHCGKGIIYKYVLCIFSNPLKKLDLRSIIVIFTVKEREQWLSASLKLIKINWVVEFFNCENVINHSIEDIFYHVLSTISSYWDMWSFGSGCLKIIM